MTAITDHCSYSLLHYRIADTLDVPEGHTFGVIVQPDEYGAGKLLQMQLPSSFDSTQYKCDLGLLSTVRQHLRLNHFHSFGALEDTFQQKDEVNLDCNLS